MRMRTPWSEKLLERKVDSSTPGNVLLECTVIGLEMEVITWTT